MWFKKMFTTCAVVALSALGLAACGSDAAPTKTKIISRTVTATPKATAAATTDDATDSAPAPSDPVPSISGVVPPNRTNTPLSLTDFFQADDWAQEVVNVADKSGVQAIRTDIDCDENDSVELRLNNAFQRLSFDVGQDSTSDSSSTSMTVSVKVNGQQVAAKTVKFNVVVPFSVSVSSANAVIIEFEEPEQNTCGGIKPVLFDAVLK